MSFLLEGGASDRVPTTHFTPIYTWFTPGLHLIYTSMHAGRAPDSRPSYTWFAPDLHPTYARFTSDLRRVYTAWCAPCSRATRTRGSQLSPLQSREGGAWPGCPPHTLHLVYTAWCAPCSRATRTRFAAFSAPKPGAQVGAEGVLPALIYRITLQALMHRITARGRGSPSGGRRRPSCWKGGGRLRPGARCTALHTRFTPGLHPTCTRSTPTAHQFTPVLHLAPNLHPIYTGFTPGLHPICTWSTTPTAHRGSSCPSCFHPFFTWFTPGLYTGLHTVHTLVCGG
jgi:hypothetical protein